jgi:hypothetical protein
MQRVWPAIPLVLAALACASSGKREARALVTSVDRYRHGDAASRSAATQAVDDVACSAEAVCAAKRACLSAMAPTTRAGLLRDEVARSLADLESKRLAPESPSAQALPSKLDLAERLLREGRTKMTECDQKLGELQVEYGL